MSIVEEVFRLRQVADLQLEIQRLQAESRAAFLSGYLQGASAMREKLQKALQNHYDYGLSSMVSNMTVPAPTE